jgi:hypothetical protein
MKGQYYLANRLSTKVGLRQLFNSKNIGFERFLDYNRVKHFH